MHHRLLLPALAWMAAAGLPAQADTPRPDPADPQAAVASLIHRSALAQYRRHDGEVPVTDWRAANVNVERIGGWRAYAREANAPEPAASEPQRASRPAPPAPGHRH